jgi:putative spermidine/putrescine transport system ATP-binding protein
VAGVVLEGVRKRYGRQAVVDGIDLAIEDGEFLVLLGPSGCGKTTTLRMVAGLVMPGEGAIRIGGADVTSLPARRRNIGMVFQDYALFPHMTVAENIGFGLRERGHRNAAVAARVAELLDLIRLAGFGARYPQQLSGGQQQRVALARALAASPAVLLMDEPFGALDLKLREAMQAELARLQRDLGITTIFVTHDQDEAMVLADRIAIMAGGRIEQLGPPEALYQNPATAFVANFLGKVNFLPATVLATGPCRVAFPDGAAGPATLRFPTTPGAAARVALRPEQVRLTPDGDDAGDGAIRGVVLQRRFLGNVVHYQVRTGWNQAVLVEQGAAAAPVETGASVLLRWDAGQALAFPAEPGAAEA